nr:MAG: hypothetical protein AM325_15380 [Candidatus Thorarchaeota archaeon SMTZ1-45]
MRHDDHYSIEIRTVGKTTCLVMSYPQPYLLIKTIVLYLLIMNALRITGYQPGAIGKITELHGRYYSRVSGFGLHFEAKVATEMSEFLNRFDEAQDGFWLACLDGEIVGSVAIDGIGIDSEGLHLRWFIVDPVYQGKGIGSRLLETALDFCRQTSANRVYLWTISGLDASRHLYEKYGFTLCHEQEGTTWGIKKIEQTFELKL